MCEDPYNTYNWDKQHSKHTTTYFMNIKTPLVEIQWCKDSRLEVWLDNTVRVIVTNCHSAYKGRWR